MIDTSSTSQASSSLSCWNRSKKTPWLFVTSSVACLIAAGLLIYICSTTDETKKHALSFQEDDGLRNMNESDIYVMASEQGMLSNPENKNWPWYTYDTNGDLLPIAHVESAKDMTIQGVPHFHARLPSYGRRIWHVNVTFSQRGKLAMIPSTYLYEEKASELDVFNNPGWNIHGSIELGVRHTYYYAAVETHCGTKTRFTFRRRPDRKETNLHFAIIFENLPRDHPRYPGHYIQIIHRPKANYLFARRNLFTLPKQGPYRNDTLLVINDAQEFWGFNKTFASEIMLDKEATLNWKNWHFFRHRHRDYEDHQMCANVRSGDPFFSPYIWYGQLEGDARASMSVHSMQLHQPMEGVEDIVEVPATPTPTPTPTLTPRNGPSKQPSSSFLRKEKEEKAKEEEKENEKAKEEEKEKGEKEGEEKEEEKNENEENEEEENEEEDYEEEENEEKANAEKAKEASPVDKNIDAIDGVDENKESELAFKEDRKTEIEKKTEVEREKKTEVEIEKKTEVEVKKEEEEKEKRRRSEEVTTTPRAKKFLDEHNIFEIDAFKASRVKKEKEKQEEQEQEQEEQEQEYE